MFEKKSEIEQAMEDASRLDDSGEGTLERPMRQPLPPPRYFFQFSHEYCLEKN